MTINFNVLGPVIEESDVICKVAWLSHMSQLGCFIKFEVLEVLL